MEANIEMVEKLVQKTGVSYTEAKAVLEESGWDVLEALILLESQGKTVGNGTAEYSTKKDGGETKEKSEKDEKKKEKCKAGENFKESGKSFWDFIRSVFDKGNSNNIEAFKDGEKKIGMPVTVFVLLLIIGFWIIVPLMIAGLFFGFRYSFSGDDLGKESVNRAMGQATDFADNIKNEIKSEMTNSENQ